MNGQKTNGNNNHVQNDSQTNNAEAPPAKKKSFFKRLICFLTVVAIIWWFNNYTLKTTGYIIFSDKITSDFRIAVISDLHAAKLSISNERITDRIEKAEPDLVFILGDMYSRGASEEEIQIPLELTEMIIEKGYEVYFVPGDHDTSQQYIDAIADAGAHVMDYRNENIEVSGNNIEILGIDNVYYSQTFDLNNAFTLNKNSYSILMAHIPNYESFADFGADLTICGDTHGGIIQLPFGKGPAYYPETKEWFPEIKGNRSDIYDKGIFRYKNGAMIITSGLGAYPFPLRINNRPEIAVIDIKAQS